MFGWIKEKRVQKEKAFALYSECVAQARKPFFYKELSVEDTLEGRFEMICLHASFLVEWLYKNQEGKLAQKFFDVMFVDIDRNLREAGVGDLAVPKRIKKMMKGFKGRAFAYREGFEAKTLGDVVKRNIGVTDKNHIIALERYITKSFAHIETIKISQGLDTPSNLFIEIEYEPIIEKRAS